MKFRWSCHIVLGLIFLLRLNDAQDVEGDQFFLQQKVENLIEKILNFIQEYYYVKDDVKCIPENVTVSLLETLKRSIDCVEEAERNISTGCETKEMRSSNFLTCLTAAKKEVRETINSATGIDCPVTATEKTFQINVTTSFTKTFNVNIKNGMEVTRKEIQLRKNGINCPGYKIQVDAASPGDIENESSARSSDGKDQTVGTGTPEKSEIIEKVEIKSRRFQGGQEDKADAKESNAAVSQDSAESSEEDYYSELKPRTYSHYIYVRNIDTNEVDD